MNLKENPFALLQVSARDNQAVIAEQYEEKISESELDEPILMAAQKDLMASKSRLAAEISWFPNLSPNRSLEILSFIETKNYEPLKEEVSSLNGISKANILSFLCEEEQGTKEVLSALFEAQEEVTTATLLNDVNANRSIAGFPRVDGDLVHESLSEIRSQHAKAALKYITSSQHPGNTFTAVVEKYALNLEIKKFLEEVAEKYESWATSTLREYEDRIKETFDQMQTGTDSQSSIDTLGNLLQKWDEYSQPMQLLHQAKGLDEARAKKLYQEMRDVCLWLANEKGEHELSLVFAQSLKEIFPELPSIAAQIDDDIQSLEDLVHQAENENDFKGLAKVFGEIIGKPEVFCDLVITDHFRIGGQGLAGELYAEFEKAVALSKGKANEAWPWDLMRKLAIYLNNEKEEPEAARIIIGKLEHIDPPSAIVGQIKIDSRTMQRNFIGKELQRSIETGDFSDAIKTVEILITLTDDPEELREYLNIKQNLKEKRRKGWIGKVFWTVIIIGAIGIFSGKDGGKKSSPTSRSNYDRTAEIKPRVGTEQLLNEPEIRWCEFQRERFQYILNQFPISETDRDFRKFLNAQLLDDSINQKFDNLIKDYNSRCESYRYKQNTLNAVQREMTASKEKIHEEARQIMRSWNSEFKFK